MYSKIIAAMLTNFRIHPCAENGGKGEAVMFRTKGFINKIFYPLLNIFRRFKSKKDARMQ